MLELLARQRYDNIEVYVPLSYGDDSYRDGVIEAGKRLFGSSFHAITDYLPRDEYLDFLASIDVAIFNHDRQQGLGNIFQLLATGSKLYLADDGDMLSHFRSLGFSVFPTSSISCETRDEFFAFKESDQDKNKRLGSPEALYRRNIALWNTALSKMTKK